MSATEPQGLPRGRHGLPRELVLENQRARLLNAMVEAVAAHGYGGTTVTDVVARARVSRQTFYEIFGDKESCYRAAYEGAFEFLRERASGASGEDWKQSLRAGLAELLESLGAYPDLARFFLISPLAVDDEAAARHHRALRELVGLLLAQAPEPASQGSAEALLQGLAGGFSRLAAARIAGDGDLPSLLPDLVELFLRPYVGIEEAVRAARAIRP